MSTPPAIDPAPAAPRRSPARWRVLVGSLLLLVCATAVVAVEAIPAADLKPKARALRPEPFERTDARLVRGRYLAEGIGQCLICHSERDWERPGAPPKAGRKGAGQVMRDDPDGRTVAPNITPDRETGAGTWPDDALARAIREGVGHDGRALHPQMWYASFRRFADEDVASIVVYLRTLPPVRNPLPATRMDDAMLREAIAGIEPLAQPVPMPDLASSLARGQYLVAVGDCSGCHTSWYSERMPGLYAGGNLIERGERKAFGTNITPAPSGVAYGADGFIQVIRTGKSGTLSPLMPWIAFRELDDADLRAIHLALQRLAPVAHFMHNALPPTQCPVCLQAHGLGDQNQVDEPKAVAVPVAELASCVGRYRARQGGEVLEVKRAGAGLSFGDAQQATRLVPLGHDRYAAPGGLLPVRFERDPQGAVVRLVEQDVEDFIWDRVRD
jgi:mono/diheme cytochrome c family protein